MRRTGGTGPTREARRRRWGTTVGASVLPAVVAVLAVVHPGAPVSQVDLHDGSVWLTNAAQLKVGRYNPQVEELNAGLVAGSPDVDVLQDAGDVVLTEPGALAVVDPASVTTTTRTPVPFTARVGMAAGTVAVEVEGSVWVRTTTTVGGLAVDRDEPDLELGEGGRAVVARGGTVLATEVDGTLHRLVPGGPDGAAVVEEEAGALAGGPTEPADDVTAVGEDLVALVGTRLHTPSAVVDLAAQGADLVLQQPGPRSPVVLVATPTALLEVPLGGGEVRVHPTTGSGRPAAPVRAAGCAHGAWASATGSYLQLCDGAGDGGAEVVDLAGMSAADELVFRVNRDVVVLNDVLRGRLWLPMQDPEVREPNWQDIEPEEEREEHDQDSESRESTQNLQTECGADSAPPAASDDDYGVRPGRTTILPVIDNDAASDCGILTVREFDALDPGFGVLEPVHGGRALQLVMAPDARGSAEFTYTVDDGRGTSAPSTATVRLTVRSDGENGAPTQVREGAAVVEQGGSVTYDALADFVDPDGDAMLLTGAVADGGGVVRTRQDGELTFTSDGSALGRVQVRVSVSDGQAASDGVVWVDVRPQGSVVPVIDPVQAVTYVDEPVVVRPLESVRSGSREPVRLAGVDEVPGATVVTDLGEGTFTFSAPGPGTYYVRFVVAVSPQEAEGLARIDVRERPEEVPPPTAVLDRALLPPGGEVTIDPLANDVDPGGGVLAVQSVAVPEGSGLRVAVLGHRLLRITSVRTLTEPVRATYVVSNGVASATGEVVIQPVPAATGQQAPVVPNVEATVRTGGVVTIAALEDAYDPDGDPLTLEPVLVEPLGPGEGLLFVSGDVLRYQAPSTARTVHATFAVRDPALNITSATVTVRVHESDPQTKAPPRPHDLTARVFAEQTVRIPVPLTGIDPDGDGVLLLGEARAPRKGRILEVGPGWLEYEALPGELGTDTFTYAVEDWVGQRATATVRVGIVPRPTGSSDVVSRNDDVRVRPGQTVEVRVLANDVDTSGGDLDLDEVLDVQPAGVAARVVGRRVVVTAPDEPGAVAITYTARNTRGGSDSAVLSVVADPDAPILPPVARDVVVPATETIDRTSVEVDVLAVAQNPSGPLADLAVEVHPSAADAATVTADGRVLVTLGPTARTLPYVLRNVNPQAEGVSSAAFITVPALGDFPPVPRPRAPRLQVVAGEQLRIPLEEQVQVAPGRTARLADVAAISATKHDGSPLFADDRTLLYTAPRSYAGPASITFEVTDATPGSTSARTRVLTLAIDVLAAEDNPPTFTPSVLDVGPGESTQVDLARFTSAPVGSGDAADGTGGPARYTYTLTRPPGDGFAVTLTGSVLTVRAAPTATRGTVGGVGVAIGYGSGQPVAGQVDFRVVASSRPLARVLDHTVPDGVEGGTSVVDVLAGASNPFAPDRLTVVGAVVEAGSGTTAVTADQVTVRPAPGFIGQVVVRYRVRDVTGDPDREVEGRITVTVRGRPATPVAPRVVEVRDRTVVLAWDAPGNNGEPISGYELTGQPGGVVRACPGTTCTVEGLTNDVEYVFTVTARNAVGVSEASPPSQPARPDARPFPPAAPVLEWGDGAVTARWSAPQNPGSPLTGYDVEISPSPPGGGAAVTTTATTHTFGGLVNGTAYTVRVRASNRAPDPGDWSPASAAVVPAGPPAAPVPSAQRYDQSIFGGGRLEVTWPAPAANGDPVARYEIRVNGGPVTAPSAGDRHVVDPAGPGTYTFEVRAVNKAGAGPWSAPLVVDHATVPSAPGNLSAEFEPATGAVRLGFTEPDWAGGRDRRVEVSVDGGPFDALAGDRRVVGLPAGTYAFVVRGCNSEGCGSASGPASATVTTPPGPVPGLAVVLDATRDPATFTATWGEPGSTGGLPVRYEYRWGWTADGADDESGWIAVAGRTATHDVPGPVRSRGGEVRVVVRAVNDRGPGPESAPVVLVVPPPAPPPEPPQEPTPPPGG
ncbi:fibronectin [Actinotalea ferrariae CF5-4]|uniref:Fibronectin n=1 Tax=Actinotalea ferrariae CF5-4 TaxID=948458 RepID=A0A021VSS9_9CELL|nr:fibronectin [Actinotalea ferrariae CF5-4]